VNPADLLNLFCKIFPQRSPAARTLRALVDFFVWSVAMLAVVGAALNTPAFLNWVSALFLTFAFWWQKGCGTFWGAALGAAAGILLAIFFWA